MSIAIGIPARYASTRFPGKPLAKLAGKPMIAHVIERALQADIGPVIVATDDHRIATVAEEYNATVCMTSAHHASGTERLAEAMADIDCDIIINIQGDEPLIDPAAIRAVVEPLQKDPQLSMATLAHPITDAAALHDANVVKVVCDAKQRALYFSRAAIPFPRTDACKPLQHVGLYAYRKDFLLSYSTLASCPTEEAEQLEQLRVLHHGYDIAVTIGNFHCIGVDSPEDLVQAERIIISQQ